MTTPTSERFDKLFATTARPPLPAPSLPHVADTTLLPKQGAANSWRLSNGLQSSPIGAQGGHHDPVIVSEDRKDNNQASPTNPIMKHTDSIKSNGRKPSNEAATVTSDSPRTLPRGTESLPHTLYVTFTYSEQQALDLFTAKSQAKIKKVKQISSKFSSTNFKIEFESHTIAKEVLEEVQSNLNKKTGRKPKVQFFVDRPKAYPKKPLVGAGTRPQPQPESLVNASEAVGSALHISDENGNKVTGHYCSLILVAKLPYKYMIDGGDRVSKQFFAANKFYEREWDLYCLCPPSTSGHAPLLLLPLHQVQQLVDDIGKAFNTTFLVPKDPFTVAFYDDGTPQPRLLGTTWSRDAVNKLQNSIPAVDLNYGETPTGAPPALARNFAAFKAKCERIRTANKGKSDLKKKKKAEDRLVAFREGFGGLRRAQRYLGLRAITKDPIPPDPSLPLDEQLEFEAEQYRLCGIKLEPIDLDSPVPHKFDKEPVIICFDIEAYERAHHIITEIGVSTLDTLDLVDLAPGKGGENWMDQIRSRHFRIKGRTHYRNDKFVGGDPEAFHFGESEFVSLAEAPRVVDNCFRYPFSAGFKQDDTSSKSKHPSSPKQKGATKRRIVILGHQIHSDIQFLKVLGSEIFAAASDTDAPIRLSEVLDDIEEALNVDVLYKVLKNEKQARSLGNVLSDLGRDAWGLHNGGNDARYTLEALIGLSVKARLEDDDKEKLKIAKQEEDMAWTEQSAAQSLPAEPKEKLLEKTYFAAHGSTLLDTHDLEVATMPLPSRSKPEPTENTIVTTGSPSASGRENAWRSGWRNAETNVEIDENEVEDDDSDDFEM